MLWYDYMIYNFKTQAGNFIRRKIVLFSFFPLFFKDLYDHALKSLHLYVFSSDNDFFFLSFLFFLFLRLSRFPDCIFLFFLFFSLLCLPALLTVFLSPPFLIFLPYFPPHIHLAPEPEEIYHYPLSSPFAFNPIRTCNFISHFSHKYVSFLKKSIYIYIW